MKTTIILYVNKKNPHKFLEIHNDGYGHNSVRQFMYWKMNGVKNHVGDGFLYRWRKNNLSELLEDYKRVGRNYKCLV